MNLFLLTIAGTAALLLMDTACYLLLRANDANRHLPVRQIRAVAIRRQVRHKW